MYSSSAPNCRAGSFVYTFIIAVLRNPEPLFQSKTGLCVSIHVTLKPPRNISTNEHRGFKIKLD
jgi:hypothetical protein